MTSANSSAKQFRSMFLHTLPFASIFPLILFVERIFHSFSHSSHDYSTSQIGFFWDYYGDYSSVSFLGDAFFVAFMAFVTAVLIFNFAWSKKQCNVVLSLGMKRSDVYLAKLLAGIVPFIAAVILSAGFEVFACAACGYKISLRYLTIVIKVIFDCIAPYVFSFSVFSLVLANVGSIIEGAVFSYLFITIPNAISNIANEFLNAYTLGSPVDSYNDPVVWNWNDPLWCASDFYYASSPYDDADIFSVANKVLITIFDWSGVIMCFVYALIATVVGIYVYNRKKNEIAGTFGRARGMTEASAVIAGLTGFYMFSSTSPTASDAPEEPYPLGFIHGCIAFIIVYIVFKLIFGYKRKKEIKDSLKRVLAYIGGLVTCVLVFYFGFFGYSSRIPSVEKIERIEVSTPLYAHLDDALSDDTYYVMKYMNIRNVLNAAMEYGDEVYYSDRASSSFSEPLNLYTPRTAYFKTESDIKKAVQVHQAFIDAGHISGSGTDTYGTKIRFTYILKDGRKITRDYFRANEEITKKILLLSDCDAVKDIQSLVWDYNSENQIIAENTYREDQSVTFDKAELRYAQSCYLFSKDMKRGFSIGQADVELLTAIAEDIRTQSANEYFYHSPDDEIGIISFGISKQHQYLAKNESEIADYDEYGLESATWNLNSIDTDSVLLTKDMTNTIRYLEEKGYTHYFDRTSTVEDISYVKVESVRTLYGQKNAYNNIPIFYGAYTRRTPVYLWGNNPTVYSEDDYYNYESTSTEYADKNPFTSVVNIKDKDQIQALLDDSMLFGFCSNDCYIMSIYYTDKTSGTVFIPAGSPSLQTLN